MENKRDIEQKKAVNSLIEYYNSDNNKVIIKATMRFGKSKVVIDFLKSILPENEDMDILIVVPRIKNKNSWKEEFKKWEYDTSRVEIVTYNSFVKIDYAPTILILDEIQNLTPAKYGITKPIIDNSRFVIGLTGTIPRDRLKKEILFNYIGFKTIYNLEIDEAINSNIINNFEIRVIKIPLSTKSDKNVKAKGFNFTTSEYKSYKYWTKQITIAPTKTNRLKRANLLYSLESKAKLAKEVLDVLRIKEKRTIVFTKRINIANLISKYVIHSKNRNNSFIEDFNSKKINELCSVEMLNEGITLLDVDSVIIESFDSNQNNLLQRVGRSLLYKEGKTIVVFILVAEGTVEEDWIKKIIPKGIKVSYYRYAYGNFKKIDNGNQ